MDPTHRLVHDFESRMAARTPDDPLHRPQNVDDLEQILRRDQLDLFAPGIETAENLADPRSRALQGQMELAWGEAQMVLADLLNDLSIRLRVNARPLELRSETGSLAAEDRAKLELWRKKAAENSSLASALSVTGMEHLWEGARVAEGFIDSAPGNYLGWRLAADFHRLRRMWVLFDEAVKELEKTNPQSNGLLFLRGVEAMDRYGDLSKARELLLKAIDRDPKFVRARVQLLLSHPFIGEAWEDYEHLRRANEHHQVVVFAEPLLMEAREAQRMQQEASKESAAPAAAPAEPAPAPAAAPAPAPAKPVPAAAPAKKKGK